MNLFLTFHTNKENLKFEFSFFLTICFILLKIQDSDNLLLEHKLRSQSRCDIEMEFTFCGLTSF